MSKKIYITIRMLCLIVILSSCSYNKYQMVDIYFEHTVKDTSNKVNEPSKYENTDNTAEKDDIEAVIIYDSLETYSQTTKTYESFEENITAQTNKEKIYFTFVKQEITEEIFSRIQGLSYSDECSLPLSQLNYIKVLHYGFDGVVHEGELIVNKQIADDIIEIFKELFEAKYPIEKMTLIDEYNADDDISMEDNNTSCFNYREIQGTSTLSNHSYGMAIDINPLYNPYVKENSKETIILPKSARSYTDRELDCEYYIKKDDICYNAFIKRGFTWGGDWKSVKDYQHFERK